MSYIGVDYGTVRVGIAVSDEGEAMAFPAEVVAQKDALLRIERLAREREARGIVIGESKDFNNKDNPVMADIQKFAAELKEKTGAEIFFEPEFLTSAAAKSAGASEKMLDASAAAIILQSFLDKRKGDGKILQRPTLAQGSEGRTSEDASSRGVASENSAQETISIDDFHKLEIRVGKIVSAEKLANADKLLRLEVSFGRDVRQIISGIAIYFPDPEALVGRTVAFAYNLAPRTIRGFESQGMILAATDEEANFSLLEAQGIKPGAKVK
ncbi:MAG: methionine--tRNA ligase subunit beta [Minisyncoccia bacterium]